MYTNVIHSCILDLMSKFNIPRREYCDGEKKLVSFRLPESLLKELKKNADSKGWPVTDLVMTVLDQYLQWDDRKRD